MWVWNQSEPELSQSSIYVTRLHVTWVIEEIENLDICKCSPWPRAYEKQTKILLMLQIISLNKFSITIHCIQSETQNRPTGASIISIPKHEKNRWAIL